jgi:hypothetical protein
MAALNSLPEVSGFTSNKSYLSLPRLHPGQRRCAEPSAVTDSLELRYGIAKSVCPTRGLIRLGVVEDGLLQSCILAINIVEEMDFSVLHHHGCAVHN